MCARERQGGRERKPKGRRQDCLCSRAEGRRDLSKWRSTPEPCGVDGPFSPAAKGTGLTLVFVSARPPCPDLRRANEKSLGTAMKGYIMRIAIPSGPQSRPLTPGDGAGIQAGGTGVCGPSYGRADLSPKPPRTHGRTRRYTHICSRTRTRSPMTCERLHGRAVYGDAGARHRC